MESERRFSGEDKAPRHDAPQPAPEFEPEAGHCRYCGDLGLANSWYQRMSPCKCAICHKQSAHAGFEEALRDLAHLAAEDDVTNVEIENARHKVRAAHAAEIEEAEQCGYAHGSTHDHDLIQQMLADARAAGIAEGRQEMARDSLSRLKNDIRLSQSACQDLFIGEGCFGKWLESQAREEE